MKKILYITSLAMLVGCGKEPAQPVTKKVVMPAQAPAKEKFSFNEEERDAINLWAEYDLLEHFYTDKETLTERIIKKYKLPEIIRISSYNYQKSYNNNEVKGDSLYLKKQINIRGTVLSIDKNFNETYSIKLDGTDAFWHNPRAIMKDSYKVWMAELEKGQKISLLCNGGGLWVETAILQDCMPADESAKNNARNLATLMIEDNEIASAFRFMLFALYHKKNRAECLNKKEKIKECRKYAENFMNDFIKYIKNNTATIKKDINDSGKENFDNAIIIIHHKYLANRKIVLQQEDQKRAEYLIKEIFKFPLEEKAKNTKSM